MTAPDQSIDNPILGCIADDVTGATDLALNLSHGGMRVVQFLGAPTESVWRHAQPFDAAVIALKSRSIAKSDAIAVSIDALSALRRMGCQRFYFKYCSTFDSTERGNIGPVAEALISALGAAQTVYCPAFPRAGRTVFQGHLFVGDRLLAESGMQRHPLNPMTDSNLVRFLAKQVDGQVGLLPYDVVAAGPDGVKSALGRLAQGGIAHVLVDTCGDSHLQTLAAALCDLPLVTGGSGLARFLPDAYRAGGLLESNASNPTVPDAPGRGLIIAGSCSPATNAQVRWMQDRCAHWRVDVAAILDDHQAELARVRAWAESAEPNGPLLIASTAPADEVAALQSQFGSETVAAAIERFLGDVAMLFAKQFSVRRFVLAGGETSGAVVSSLGVQALRIGPEICAGVPWTETVDREPKLALALKSGNFGDEDFFATALEMLP